MIVYEISVDIVDKRAVSPIHMGKLMSTDLQQRKEFIKNARGKCGKIPNKICER